MTETVLERPKTNESRIESILSKRPSLAIIALRIHTMLDADEIEARQKIGSRPQKALMFGAKLALATANAYFAPRYGHLPLPEKANEEQ